CWWTARSGLYLAASPSVPPAMAAWRACCSFRSAPALCRNCPYLVQILAHEIQNVLAVETEHATRAAARPVEPERGHTGDDVAAADVIWTAGVAKAGAAARGVVGQKQREVSCKAGRVDLYEPGFREHPDLLGLDEDGIDLLEPVPHRGKQRGAAGLQCVELVDVREFPVRARREFDFPTEQHDPYVMPKELGFGEQRMGMPFLRLDGVRTRKRIVVVAVLDIRFGEDAHAAELARLARAMSGGEDDFGGDQSAGDRKSTRLNSSHVAISYAVFCLKKKKYTR